MTTSEAALELFKRTSERMRDVESFRSRSQLDVASTVGQNLSVTVDVNKAQDGRVHVTYVTHGPAGAETTEMIIAETDVYLQIPDLGWIRTSAEFQEELVSQLVQSANIGFFDLFPAGDVPWEIFAVESLGRGRVDGVPAEHIRVRLDFEELWQSIDEKEKQRLFQAIAPIGAARGLEDLEEIIGQVQIEGIELWIDEEGYTRRSTFQVVLFGLASSAWDTRVYDFGEEISIELPETFEDLQGSERPEEQEPGVGTPVSVMGNEHIATGILFSDYNSIPPTSGPHWAEPARCGSYDAEIPDEQLVHNLEHGNVVISYNLPNEGEAGRLIRFLETLPGLETWAVVRPYSKISPGTIAMTAWGVIDHISGVDEQRIETFFLAYAGNRLSPETAGVGPIPCGPMPESGRVDPYLYP